MVHETKLTSEISYITDSYLAQLAEHQSDDQVVKGSNPIGRQFLMKLIVLCVTLDLSDNRISLLFKTRVKRHSKFE